MGCCTAQQNAPRSHSIQIRYQGKDYPIAIVPPDLNSFRTRVYLIDPILRRRAWHIQTQGAIPIDLRTPQEYNEYINRSGQQNLGVNILVSKAYLPKEPLNKYVGAVFMVLDHEGNVLGNGILITKKHALLADSLVARKEDLKNFSAYFQLETDIILPYKQNGLFIHAAELEVVIAEIDLSGPTADPVRKLNPVYVQDVKHVPRKELMDYLYNSKVYPALRYMPDSKIKENEDRFYIVDKGPDQAIGAPLFYKDSRFAGVLLEPKADRKRVLIITELLKYLREKYPGMVDDDQNYVDEVFQGMGIGREAGEEVVFDSADNRKGAEVAQEPEVGSGAVEVNFEDEGVIDLNGPGKNRRGVESGQEPEVGAGGGEIDFGANAVFDAAPPPLSVYTKSAFHLLPKTGTTNVWYHGKADYEIHVEKMAVDLRPGFTFTSFPDGVLVAGGRETCLRKAFLWSQSGLTPLPDLPSRHSYHSAAYFNDWIYIISGEETAETSGFSVKNKAWEKRAILPGRAFRAHTGASAFEGKIYLAGGVLSSGDLSNEVLQYNINTDEWRSLATRLEFPVTDLGLQVLSGGRLLVYGGRGADTKPRDELYTKDLEQNTIESKGKLPEPAVFREYSPSLERDFLIFSSSGRLFMFSEKDKEFLLVSLPSPSL